ncbi:MAG: hypothetical protein EOO41_01495, partial [Methanobacteriota archaeon]
ASSAAAEARLAEYRSAVYYHCNTPTYDETLAVRLPSHDQWESAHMLFSFWHASSQETRTHMFAFAWLPLTAADGTPVRDGKHTLRCYKVQPWMEGGTSFFPWYLYSRVVDAVHTEVLPAIAPANATRVVPVHLASSLWSPADTALARSRSMPQTAVPTPLAGHADWTLRRLRKQSTAVSVPYAGQRALGAGVAPAFGVVPASGSSLPSGGTASGSAPATRAAPAAVGPIISASIVAGAQKRPLTSSTPQSKSTLLGGMLGGMFGGKTSISGASATASGAPTGGSRKDGSTGGASASNSSAGPRPVTRSNGGRRASFGGSSTSLVQPYGDGSKVSAAAWMEAHAPLELRRDVFEIETRLVSDVRSNIPELHLLAQWQGASHEELVSALTHMPKLLNDPLHSFRCLPLLLHHLLDMMAAQPSPSIPHVYTSASSSEAPESSAVGDSAAPTSGLTSRKMKLLSLAFKLLVSILDKYFASMRPAERAPGEEEGEGSAAGTSAAALRTGAPTSVAGRVGLRPPPRPTTGDKVRVAAAAASTSSGVPPPPPPAPARSGQSSAGKEQAPPPPPMSTARSAAATSSTAPGGRMAALTLRLPRMGSALPPELERLQFWDVFLHRLFRSARLHQGHTHSCAWLDVHLCNGHANHRPCTKFKLTLGCMLWW